MNKMIENIINSIDPAEMAKDAEALKHQDIQDGEEWKWKKVQQAKKEASRFAKHMLDNPPPEDISDAGAFLAMCRYMAIKIVVNDLPGDAVVGMFKGCIEEAKNDPLVMLMAAARAAIRDSKKD